MMPSIRLEQTGDTNAIRVVNEQAFGQSEEAAIVDRLRDTGSSVLSLVAILDDAIVAHIQFSPVAIAHDQGVKECVGLAPMAVLPEFQNQRIGSALVWAGLKVLRIRSYPCVLVLGHPQYYPRFGFKPASKHGIACQWKDIPEEAFMVLSLDEQAMRNVSGEAEYRDVFALSA